MRMVIVIEAQVSDNHETGFNESQQILNDIKPLFKDKEGVKVYGAIKDTADTILDVLKLGAE